MLRELVLSCKCAIRAGDWTGVWGWPRFVAGSGGGRVERGTFRVLVARAGLVRAAVVTRSERIPGVTVNTNTCCEAAGQYEYFLFFDVPNSLCVPAGSVLDLSSCLLRAPPYSVYLLARLRRCVQVSRASRYTEYGETRGRQDDSSKAEPAGTQRLLVSQKNSR